MVTTETKRARGELLSAVLVNGCLYMRATVCVCCDMKMSSSTGNRYTDLYINVKHTVHWV